MIRDRRRQAFTLLEVMLVLALLGLLFATVLPKASNLFRVSVQSSVRRFGSMVRFAYDQSILTGRLHRIVLNLDEQTWGVEAANPGELPIDKAKRELNPWLKNQRKKDDEEGDADEPSFKKVGGGILSAMPNGVAIVDVKSWRLGDKAQAKGVISIYAYPSGLIDEATVRFAELGKEDSQSFSVTILPITGRIETTTERPK